MHKQREKTWNVGGGGFWIVPAFFGLLLIVFGILIFYVPKLLDFIVAAVFVLAGCVLLGIGWRLRGRITYRSFEHDEPSQRPFFDGRDKFDFE